MKKVYLPVHTALSLSICFLIIFAGGCQQKQEAHKGPREKITVAHFTGPTAALVHIAFMKGYFAEEGLDAILQPHAFGKLALNSVMEGKADIATTGDTPFVFAVMNGKEITALASIQTANKNTAIVGRQDRGITKPSDLKGKKIGVTLGTTADFFLDSFLIFNMIDRNEVTLVGMTPAEMAAALESGKVDAVSTFNPTVYQLAKGLGSRGIVFYGELIYTESVCLAASQEYVKKNPEAIKKFLRALVRADMFVMQHDKEARSLEAEFLKMDKTVLDEMWGLITFKVTLNEALLMDFEDQTRWVLKYKLASRATMPNYLDYIYADGLYAVKPEAVRIVR